MFKTNFMFFRNLLPILSLILMFSSFGLSLSTSAEAFNPSGDFDVVNLTDCNLSVKYNKQKFQLNTLSIGTETNHFLSSNADDKVFVRFFCSTYDVTGKISDLGPFWTGANPDFTKKVATSFSVKAYGSDPATAGYVTYVKNSESASKMAVISYSYRSTGFGSISDLNNGTFSTQAQIQNSDIAIKFITDPVVSPVTPAATSEAVDFETIDFNDCETYIKYNKSKFQTPTRSATEILLNSKNGKGYVKIRCDKTQQGGEPGLTVPFWTGAAPDLSKYFVVSAPVIQYDVPNPTYMKYIGSIFKDGSKILNKSYFVIEYYYDLDDSNRKLAFSEQIFANAIGMSIDDLKIGFKDVATQAATPAQTSNTDQITKSPEAQTVNTNSDQFRFNKTNYPSCDGKMGKYLNMKGEIVKKPKTTSKLIYADNLGTILGSEDNIIYCIKNAKKYGSVNCSGKIDQIVDFKGKKMQYYPRGVVYYANSDFGNIYTHKSNAINCTTNNYLLNSIKW